MKVLVTGGAGFIGTSLIDHLRSIETASIVALQNRTPLPSSFPEPDIIKGGMSSLSKKALLDLNPDVIFHLARPTFPLLRKPGRFLAGSYGGFLNENLLRKMTNLPSNTKLVYVSGSLMYGSSKDHHAHDETATLNPISYARSYISAETPILRALRNDSTDILMVRLPWVLGKGSWFEWIYNAHIAKYESVPLFGEGHNKMQFILRADAAKLISDLAFNGAGGIRNVFGPQVITQLQFAEYMANLKGLPIDQNPTGYDRAIQEAFRSEIILSSKYRETVDLPHGDVFDALDGLLKNK